MWHLECSLDGLKEHADNTDLEHILRFRMRRGRHLGGSVRKVGEQQDVLDSRAGGLFLSD